MLSTNRARQLDLLADRHLSEGRHGVAERLSHEADLMRQPSNADPFGQWRRLETDLPRVEVAR